MMHYLPSTIDRYAEFVERLKAMAVLDDDLEIRLQAKIALRLMDPTSEGVNEKERNARLKEREEQMWDKIHRNQWERHGGDFDPMQVEVKIIEKEVELLVK